MKKEEKLLEDIKNKIARVLNRVGNNVVSEIKKQLSGEKLKVRTGRLRNSWQYTVIKENDKMYVKIASNVKYARIHEVGGVIQPKKAKKLAIPINPTLFTKAGVLRYSSPREVPGLFVKQTRSGNLFLMKREGNSLKAYYLLKDRVEIKPKYYVKEAILRTENKIKDIIQKDLAF